MNAKAIRYVGLVFLVVVVGGFLAFRFYKKNRTQTSAPKRGPIVEAVYGIGTVTPEKNFELKVGVAMSIQKLFVTEGEFVKAGSPMVLLESSNLFRAPFDGTITSLPFKVGETVFPQTTVIELTDIRDRYVLVSLEQQGALRVKKGQLARLSFESLRGHDFTGVVRSIYPNNGQFFVRIDVQNLIPEVLPGMTADVAIEISKRDQALLVPASAISAGKIWIERDGKKRKVEVEIGSVDGEWAEIVSGDISETDRVVVAKGK